MKQIQVAVVMGSESDRSTMEETGKLLQEFGVSFEYKVTSAHRTPEETSEYAKNLKKTGIQVVIAAAGYANHLAGTIAAHTTLPVIGVPLESSSLQGLDALLSTVQMPAGIPVATVTIGKAGAKNAALLAVEILALQDETLSKKINDYRNQWKNR